MSETEILIDLVRERPFLYDMNDPEYKNRPKRLASWKEIANEMGSGNADSWYSKWKILKNNYLNYKKSSEPVHGDSFKKYRNWPWAEVMRFLDHCTSTKRILSMVELYIPDDYDNMTNAGSSKDQSNKAKEEGQENRKRNIHSTEPTEEDQENHNIKKNNKPTLDGVDQFFLSYAQSFRKLPIRMQIMLKLEIATLFSRYELQADEVAPESIDNGPRIVPNSVKSDIWFAKWKGLKDNFVKFKKSSEPAHADTYKNYKKWPWAEKLMFLDDCFSSRRIPKYRPKPRRETRDPKLQSLSNFEMNIPAEKSTNSDSSIDQPNKSLQEEQESTDDDQENHSIKKCDKNSTMDGVEHFFLSYAQSFKKLPVGMQIMLKLEIATLFSRYELQADEVTPESIHNIPRIVPHPVKREFDLTNIIVD